MATQNNTYDEHSESFFAFAQSTAAETVATFSTPIRHVRLQKKFSLIKIRTNFDNNYNYSSVDTFSTGVSQPTQELFEEDEARCTDEAESQGQGYNVRGEHQQRFISMGRPSNGTTASGSMGTSSEDTMADIKKLLQEQNALLKNAARERGEIKLAVEKLAREVFSLKANVNKIRKKHPTLCPSSLLPSFPINCKDELLELEKRICVEAEIADALRYFFATIAGPDVHSFVKKSFQAIMTDDVAIQFTWMGLGNNIKIKKFTIISIFKEAAMRRFPSLRPDELESFLKKKFRDFNGRWKSFGKYMSLARNALAVTIGTLIAYLLRESEPFKLTGHMDSGLPPLQPPPFSTTVNGTHVDFAQMVTRLSASIFTLPAVSILENVAITKSFSKGKLVAASQEMVALGICNFCGSFVSSMPITASFTRTAINNASGVRTTLGGIVTGVLVLLTLGFLTDAFYYIPKATLAAIIISAMIFLFHYEKPVEIWKSKKIDILPYLTTLIVCIFLGLEIGIVTGIVLNLTYILYETARPKVEFQTEKISGYEVLIARPTQSLPFSAAENLQYKVIKHVTNMRADRKYVVIDGELIRSIDTTTAWNLISICDAIKLLNTELLLWNWNKNTAGIAYRLRNDLGKYFRSGIDAIEYIRKDIENKNQIADLVSIP